MRVRQSAWHAARMLQYVKYLLTLADQLVQYYEYVLAFVQCPLTPVHP